MQYLKDKKKKKQRLELLVRASVVWQSETWISHSLPSGLTMRSQWTLYPKLCIDSWFGLTFSKKRSLKVCVACSRWMIWHLEEMPAGRKVGTSRVIWGCVRIRVADLAGFLLYILRRSSVHFLASVLNLCGRLAVSERGACLKCCYLTWQEQGCRQSPETAPCQWNTTDCGMDSPCEAPSTPMFTLSDGTFWQASHKQRKSIVFYCVTYLFWEITSASSIILATVQRHTLQEGDTINH